MTKHQRDLVLGEALATLNVGSLLQGLVQSQPTRNDTAVDILEQSAAECRRMADKLDTVRFQLTTNNKKGMCE